MITWFCVTRRKLKPCQGDKAEGKWQGLQGQSTWDTPRRSWWSQLLTSDSTPSHPEFLQNSVAFPAVSNALSTPGETHSSLHASLSCRFLRTQPRTQPSTATPIPGSQHRLCGVCFASTRFSRETQSFLLQTEMTLSPPAQGQELGLLGQWRRLCSDMCLTLSTPSRHPGVTAALQSETPLRDRFFTGI